MISGKMSKLCCNGSVFLNSDSRTKQYLYVESHIIPGRR